MQYNRNQVDDLDNVNPIAINNNYKDDEPIEVKEFVHQQGSQKVIDLENNLVLSLTSIQKVLKLSSTQTQTLAVQVGISYKQEKKEEKELNVKDFQKDERPGVDLICVIDKSGSMNGEKIQLVKSTLLQLVEMLNEGDRLSIIQFESNAQRILPLVAVSKKNAERIKIVIKSINSSGGTNIGKGMYEAFQTIKNRRVRNQVTSIFLLSDGLDGSGLQNVQSHLDSLKLTDNFTINTFGFG